ncbi:MAG TPA: hypothetical protein PLM07_08540, partial [Candidatus Rifleibacterium sp.]|nr:hypothetical protein [Candidatus Rifleibacterium sp.]
MKLLLRQIETGLDYGEEDLRKTISQRLSCPEALIKSISVQRRSLDSRPWRASPVFVMSVEVELPADF